MRLLRLLLAVLLTASSAYAEPIHVLKPPLLRTENVLRQVLCHRPMRQAAPNISLERIDDKIIMHNYGHGGSGWTLAPGCTQYLVQKCIDQYKPHPSDPLVIIGAGVIGLFTAYYLVKAGFTNITVVAKQYDDLTSHKAGGFLAPSTLSAKTFGQETQSFIDRLCFDAYRFYAAIARGNNFDFAAQGARFVPVYLTRDDERLAAYEDVVMQRPYDVIIDFSNGKQYEMKVYEDAIFMDTDILMQSLRDGLKDKVVWLTKKVDSFAEIDARYIFNCAGLGAKALCDDDQLLPVQGHLLMLTDQQPEDMQYMISLFVSYGVTESGHTVKRSLYMFPKQTLGASKASVGVLGGTFIEEADGKTPNEHEFELMLKRAQEFFGE